jgi:hypothetical protein
MWNRVLDGKNALFLFTAYNSCNCVRISGYPNESVAIFSPGSDNADMLIWYVKFMGKTSTNAKFPDSGQVIEDKKLCFAELELPINCDCNFSCFGELFTYLLLLYLDI